MRKRSILSAFAVIIMSIACYELAMTSSTSPPVSRTGAPGEGKCSDCHGNLNTGPGDILLSLDTVQYVPGNTYSANLQVIDGGKTRFGFQITVLDSNDNMAGSFIITNTINTTAQTNIGRNYVSHLNANSTSTWQFDWVAPGTDLGPLTFYIAGNGANNNGSSSGDNIYTRAFLIQSCTVSPSIAGTNVTCNGDTTGSANLTVTGGVPPLSFLWSTTDTTEDISNLAAGIYHVTITDSVSCTVTDSVVITEPLLALVNAASSTDVTCFGYCNGIASASISGGTPPYTYIWDDPDTQTDSVATALCAATYNVTVTDFNGCILTDTYIITEPQILIASLASKSTDNCSTCNGTATISVTGGVTPYTYTWSGGCTDSSCATLCIGIFIVAIADNNGCTAVVNDSILGTILLSNTIGSTSSTCGLADGSAFIVESGGAQPYTYLWNDFLAQTTDSAIGLVAGNYTVIVTDSNGCLDSATVNVGDLGSPIITTDSLESATCNGSSDGAIYISVSGGTGPLTYSWDNGATSEDIDSLLAATYIVTVIDSVGCSSNQSVVVTEPGVVAPIVDSINNVTCIGDATGYASVNTTGGTSPYSFTWQNALLDTIGTNANNITGVTEGNYMVSVVDINGCTGSTTLYIGASTSLANLHLITSNISCNGGTNGSAAVIVSSTVNASLLSYTATSNYNTYYNFPPVQDLSYINDGDLDSGAAWGPGAPDPFELTLTFSQSVILDSVKIKAGQLNGDYNVPGLMLFYNGTSSGTLISSITPTFNFESYSLSNSTGNSIYTFEITPTLDGYAGILEIECYGTVELFDSTLNYSWTGPNAYTSGNAANTGLEAGNYSVVVSHLSGCTLTDSVEITQPDSLTLSVISENLLCNSVCAGNTNAQVSGGISPYSYLWTLQGSPVDSVFYADSLCAGTYTVLITDSNGCVMVDSTTLTQPDSLAASLSSVDNSCYGGSDGSATATASGGTPPYSYSWDDGLLQSSSMASGLASAIYSVVITDSNGCKIGSSSNLKQNYIPSSSYNNYYTTNDLSQIYDGNLNTGTIWGAPVPASFEMIMTFPSAVIINAVKVRAGQFSGDYYSPELMELHRGSSAGPIIASIAPTYTFDLYNIINTNSDTVYTWVITPSDTFASIREIECFEVTDPTYVVVSEPTELIVIDSTTNQSSPGAGDGSIDLTVTGATPPYSYSWSTGASSEDLVNLVGGTYTITVSDSNNCTKTLIIVIPGGLGLSELHEGIADIAIYPNPNDGSFILSFNSVESQDIQLSISDIKGQVVYTDKIVVVKGMYEKTISVESLPPGIYMLQMVTSSGLYTRKLVVR